MTDKHTEMPQRTGHTAEQGNKMASDGKSPVTSRSLVSCLSCNAERCTFDQGSS